MTNRRVANACWGLGFLALAWLSSAERAWAGESCAEADPLLFAAPGTVSTLTSAASEASLCGQGDSYAGWFSFQAPVDDHYKLATRSVDGEIPDTTLAIFARCDDDLPMQCNDDQLSSLGAAVDLQLAAGQVVLVRVAGWGGTRGDISVVADTYGAFERPLNDACEDAFTVSQAERAASTTLNATGTDLSSCGLEDSVDVWYTFTAPAAGSYDFTLTQQMTAAHFVAVFDGCAGSELACGHLATSATLEAGQEVRVRVGTNPSVADAFNLVIGPLPPAAVPENDTHVTATEVGVPSTTMGTTRGATQDGMNWGPVCGPLINDAIWYSFTAPDDDVYVFDTNGSEMTDTVLAVLDACDSNGAVVPQLFGCDDNFGQGGAARLDGFLEAGTSLCFAVAGHYLSEEGGVVFNVSRLGDPPANDTCAAASEIALGETIFEDNYTATFVDAAGPCPLGNFPLWFSFTAPESGLYKVDTKESVETSPDIAIYASCDAAQPIGCSIETNAAAFAELAAGQTVLIRASTDVFWRSEMAVRVGPVREDEGEGGAGGEAAGGAGTGGAAEGGAGQGGASLGGGGQAPTDEEPKSGCDCRVGSARDSRGAVGVLLGATVWALWRRRTAQSAPHRRSTRAKRADR